MGSSDNIVNLTYQLKDGTEQHSIRKVGEKMECPLCKIAVKNVHLHFSRKADCGNKIDMNHFSNIFETHKKNLRKVQISEAVQRNKKKEERCRSGILQTE